MKNIVGAGLKSVPRGPKYSNKKSRKIPRFQFQKSRDFGWLKSRESRDSRDPARAWSWVVRVLQILHNFSEKRYYFWSWYMKVYVDWRGVNYPGAEGAGYEGGWCGIGVWGRGCQLEAHKWMSLVRTLSELESHEIYLGETWHLWTYCQVLYYSSSL